MGPTREQSQATIDEANLAAVDVAMDVAATACYMFTSGTTGLPKAAFITHSKWIATGKHWLVMAEFSAVDVEVPEEENHSVRAIFFSSSVASSTPSAGNREMCQPRKWRTSCRLMRMQN